MTLPDYSGVERDIAGNPISNGRGSFFDHVKEMKDSYKGLKKAKRRLEGSLKNPNLDQCERAMLTDALTITNEHIHKIDELFRPYGGIEKWTKK